jgi:ectoine hydroxylase-related dioxygenase (phytanoyl-CoA dioxygenase family)
LWDEVVRLNLQDHIAELEVKGLTVLPPEKVASPEFVERLRQAVLDTSERRHGVRPDLEKGASHTNSKALLGAERLTYVLAEDPAFVEALLNPRALTMAQYLLGTSVCLSSFQAHIKGPGGLDLGMHCDTILMPPPYPAAEQVCNATWALTDYTRENGATFYIPGSHKYRRQPLPGEEHDQRVFVEAPAGSIIFWGGNLWHGSVARTAPGLRLNLIVYMCRPHLRTQEVYPGNVPLDQIRKNPRLARLLGMQLNYGWREEGPQNEEQAYMIGRSEYD